MENLSELERRIISELQGDIPIVENPFSEISRRLGVEENRLIQVLESFRERGLLRRVGAVLDHYKVGYTCNVMVAWQVNPERVSYFARIASRYSQITHCYRRSAPEIFPYNVYTMIHGHSRRECESIIQEISSLTGTKEYKAYYTKKQYKKTSMKYIQYAVAEYYTACDLYYIMETS